MRRIPAPLAAIPFFLALLAVPFLLALPADDPVVLPYWCRGGVPRCLDLSETKACDIRVVPAGSPYVAVKDAGVSFPGGREVVPSALAVPGRCLLPGAGCPGLARVDFDASPVTVVLTSDGMRPLSFFLFGRNG